jgi:hypothetical protein
MPPGASRKPDATSHHSSARPVALKRVSRSSSSSRALMCSRRLSTVKEACMQCEQGSGEFRDVGNPPLLQRDSMPQTA